MSSHRLTLTPADLLVVENLCNVRIIGSDCQVRVRGNHQACFLLSHPVFLVLAIGNVANTSVHRLCMCRFQSVCKCLVCVWAGTIGVRVKWVVGRWQHGDHYQKGNVCLISSAYVIHCWASRPIMCWSANHDWPISDFRHYSLSVCLCCWSIIYIIIGINDSKKGFNVIFGN